MTMSPSNGKTKTLAETQLQVSVGVLLESLTDKSHAVREAAANSLAKISEKYPNQLIQTCSTFCLRSPKLELEHMGAVLKIISKIFTDQISNVDADTAQKTIEFSLKLLTQSVTYEPIVQGGSSNVLVALGRVYHKNVTEALLKNVQAGVVPHYGIAHTLGALANLNPYNIVPHLPAIFSTLTPMLNDLKSDHLKQEFAYAIQNLAEGLTEYISNPPEELDEEKVTPDIFKTELSLIYDILVFNWLLSRDSKLVESVLQAVAAVFIALPIDKVSQQIPKIIPTLLNLYKKGVNSFIVTKCLYAVLTKAVSVNGMLLEPFLPNILNTLVDFVCLSPDYAQPDSARCHSEVLRCYECITVYFTDTTIDKVLVYLKNNNDKDKLKGLIVITHLVTYSADQVIQRRLKDILKHISELLNESHIKLKKVLMKIVLALAHKKVLINPDLNPEGPDKYLEFILTLCCKQTLPKNTANNDEHLDLQMSADNSLFVLTTSVPELENALWNLFVKCLLNKSYDGAVIVLLRCLTYLASKKERYERREDVFVRCMILLSNPLPALRGTFILNFLRNTSPCDIPSYQTVWNLKLPQLSKYLDENYDSFHMTEWHTQLFDFLHLLLGNVNNVAFNEILLSTSQKQLELYNSSKTQAIFDKEVVQLKMEEKRFLLKLIATISSYIKPKDQISQTIDNLLANVRLTDFSDLEACAEAVGITSRVHLQLVLEKLAHIRKELSTKKSSTLFSFMKNHSNELGIERLRYVLIYSYAQICNEAPSEELLVVIESEILDFVTSELLHSKEFAIKRACLKAVESVAGAMHPNHNKLHIKMNSRDAVIDAVFNQMHLHSGPDYIELFPKVISAMTALAKLPLPLESDTRIRLIKLFFDNVFNAASIYCKIDPESSDSYFGYLKMAPFVTKSFGELNLFVQELLLQSLSPSTLDEIVTLLESWLGKKKQEQRLPAVETLRLILQTYLDHMRFAHDLPSTFGQTGSLLAKIVPRCTDPNRNVRKISVECVLLVLCIASRYEGHMRDHDKVLSNSLQKVQQNIESDDPKTLFNTTSDLAHVICVNLPQFQLVHFVDGLVDGLLDVESSSSCGAGVVLHVTLKNKGHDVQNHVPHITTRLLAQLTKIQCVKTKSTTLRALQSLASHHSRSVGGILLMQTLPYSQSICECWSTLSTDKMLVQDLLDQIKKIIRTTPLYEVQGDGVNVASLSPLQAVCALQELFKNNQLEDVCLEQFAELFSLLLICLASYVGSTAPAIRSLSDKKEKLGFIINREAYKLNPVKVAFETFRLFLSCCKLTNIASNFLCFTMLETSEDKAVFLKIVEMLASNICLDMPQSLSWIVSSLGPFIRSDLELQKVAVVAFFTYFFKQGAQKDQTVLIENILEMILDVQMDHSCLVRRIGLEGLGYAAENLNKDLVSRHCNQILGVLMNSLDYHNLGAESDVIVESLTTFSKLLTALEGYKFHSFQVTAAVRIKLLFGQEDCHLRRASFRLLGDLASSLSPETNIEAFKEQVQGNLITLLLHLSDPDMYVVKACKYTLRQIGPLLDSEEVNGMIQEHLIDEANLHYTDFIKDFIKLMARDLQDLFYLFVMTSVSYVKSPWTCVRGNGALVTGLLYSELSAENLSKVSLDAICDKLIRLMQDEAEEVRVKASQALSYVFMV